MYYTFDIEQQIQSIMKKCKATFFDKSPKTTNDLCDITDGDLYKSVLASVDGPLFKKIRAFSFSMNTDGASLSKISKMSMPIYYACNIAYIINSACD